MLVPLNKSFERVTEFVRGELETRAEDLHISQTLQQRLSGRDNDKFRRYLRCAKMNRILIKIFFSVACIEKTLIIAAIFY